MEACGGADSINPRLRENKRIQGLVLGYVTERLRIWRGIAKAADSGYKFVIVFAGLTDALRKQTQIRVKMTSLIELKKDGIG